jgi:hypothetical protein
MHKGVAIARSAGLVLLAAMAACTVGSPGSSSAPDGGPADTPSVTPAVTAAPATPAPTHPPTPSPGASAPTTVASPAITLPAEPPAAVLAGLIGDPVTGDLGTVSWGGFTSDAPWVIGLARGGAASGARLTVTFDPAIQPTTWRARWAPVEGREAGSPHDGGTGRGKEIAVVVPRRAGDWSLQVEAHFGGDSGGAWYWRIQVNP